MEKILESNKLIALFDPQMTVHKLDRRLNENRNYLDGFKYEGFKKGDVGNIRGTEHLQYHSSWDWIIPIVKKIKDLKYLLIVENDSVVNYLNNLKIINHGLINADIKEVYKGVLEFITWYNNKEK